MRVLFAMPLAERRAGAEQLLWTTLRHAADADVDPAVVFLADGSFPGEVEALGIPTWVVDPGRFREPLRGARAVGRLRTLIARQRPDVILSWMPRAHVTLAPAAVAAGAGGRMLWWQHEVHEREGLVRLATALPARAVIASSEAAADAQRGLRPRREVVAVHPGTEEPPAAADAAALRAQAGVPADATVVGLVGRLIPVKRQHDLIAALAEAPLARPGVHALLVGGEDERLGPAYREELDALARRLGVSERVHFTGQVADGSRWIGALDVLVNARVGESFGLTIVEAMALGVPVVVVAVDGPAEIVEDGTSGLTVASPSPPALARAVARVVDDASLRARLIEGGRRRYEERFTAAAFAARLGAALERLAPR